MATKRKAAKITDSLGRERKAERASFGKIRETAGGKRFHASYVGPDGVRHNAPTTYDTRGDAETWLGGQRAALASGSWTSPGASAAAATAKAQTLGQYAETWIAERTNAKGDKLKPRTREEYTRLVAGPLAGLGALTLSALTPARVRTWRTAQMDTGKKTQTSRAYGLLNAICATAVLDGFLASNPCVGIRGGQSTHTGRKVIPPTDAELDVILETITPRFRALAIVAAIGGLRFGEATALRARDVTVERVEGGSPVVRLNVVRGVVRTSEGIVPGETKSEAGVRKVAIFHEDAAIVADHIAGKVEGTKRLIGDALLFPAADGVGFLAQSAFWRHWDRARTAAGRPDMPFHALRHYAGTRYAQNATFAETMKRLGHSTPGAAMRYQHATDRDDELAARMSRRSTSA